MQKAKSVYCIKTKNCGNILQNKGTCNCAIHTANNLLMNSYKYTDFILQVCILYSRRYNYVHSSNL